MSETEEYKIMPEMREQAFENLRDVGVIALARRIDRLEAVAARLFGRLEMADDILPVGEQATLSIAAVVVCREISRLVDRYDPEGIDGIPNLGGNEGGVELLSQEQARAATQVLAQYLAEAEEAEEAAA